MAARCLPCPTSSLLPRHGVNVHPLAECSRGTQYSVFQCLPASLTQRRSSRAAAGASSSEDGRHDVLLVHSDNRGHGLFAMVERVANQILFARTAGLEPYVYIGEYVFAEVGHASMGAWRTSTRRAGPTCGSTFSSSRVAGWDCIRWVVGPHATTEMAAVAVVIAAAVAAAVAAMQIDDLPSAPVDVGNELQPASPMVERSACRRALTGEWPGLQHGLSSMRSRCVPCRSSRPNLSMRSPFPVTTRRRTWEAACTTVNAATGCARGQPAVWRGLDGAARASAEGQSALRAVARSEPPHHWAARSRDG